MPVYSLDIPARVRITVKADTPEGAAALAQESLNGCTFLETIYPTGSETVAECTVSWDDTHNLPYQWAPSRFDVISNSEA